MRFFALLTVRDEVDVIDRCLSHLRSWADAVFILDTGSTDGTWKRIGARARTDDRIVPLARRPVLFNEGGVRGHLFDLARDRFAPGDWICRADADEVYLIDPREFVRTRLRRGEGAIAARQFVFGMTRAEARAWARGEESPADRARPLEERRTRFVMDEFPEARFFRYRASMVWPARLSMPAFPGLLAVERIPMRHDRYRDPPQMRQRSALRAIVAARTDTVGEHWKQTDWRAQLLPNRARTMKPDDPLPVVAERNPRSHLGPPMRRLVRVGFYRLGLAPLADRFQRRAESGLEPIPRALQRRLARRPGLSPRTGNPRAEADPEPGPEPVLEPGAAVRTRPITPEPAR